MAQRLALERGFDQFPRDAAADGGFTSSSLSQDLRFP
jgi:hypothetical protein